MVALDKDGVYPVCVFNAVDGLDLLVPNDFPEILDDAK